MRRISLCLIGCSLLLAQDDPKQRIKAARALAKEGSGAIPKLQPMLGDPDQGVRVEAVRAIVECGTQHSLEPLIQATRDNDPEIQIRATDGLVNFYLPGYVETGFSASLKRAGTALKGRFTDVNDRVIDPFIQVRPEVVTALGVVVRGGGSMDARANAARAAGILRGQAALPDLIQALRSKDDQLIYESLVAIQKIRDKSAATKISFLLNDLQERVQIAAIETTGLLQNQEALPDLRGALERAESKKVRRAALTALAMIPDESSRSLFVGFLYDKDDGMRAAAAEGLGRMRSPRDLPVLEKSFAGERKMSPRLSMAFALVLHGKTEIAEFSPLQYLVNTLNSRAFRGVAQPFLIEVCRDEQIRKSIYPLMARGTPDEKIGLVQVLARSGDKDSVAPVDALTRDADPAVAQEALRSVRTLRARL